MPTASARLIELVSPSHTVVVTMELQKGVVGADALLPALPVAVQESGLLDVAGRVCRAARATGVRVVHATVRHRADGAGHAANCRLLALLQKRSAEIGWGPTDVGQPGVALVDELDVQPSDIEVPRSTGLTPFTSTALDQTLRNLGAHTIVLVGVSLNLGIIGAALSGVDLGYQVVVVRDAVVGVPRAYGDALLENSVSMIATIVNSDELLAAWSSTATATDGGTIAP